MAKEECIKEHTTKVKEAEKKKENKEWKKRKRKLEPEVYTKKYKTLLQNEINKLARNIDSYFNLPCVDCGRNYGKQADGAHFHNSKGNENIRYNLHNIHKARSDCNQYNSEHKVGYRKGLIERYSEEYLDYVDNQIGLKYKSIHLSNVEVSEKLAVVRKLNRDFDTFILENPKNARDMFNKLIGIYA